MKEELNKRKANNRAELIETIREVWSDLDKEIIRNCAYSMIGKRWNEFRLRETKLIIYIFMIYLNNFLSRCAKFCVKLVQFYMWTHYIIKA